MLSNEPKRVGVVLTNLGTPDKPDRGSVKKFLAEFLWDQRVVDLPRLLWWPILHGIVLTTRPQKVARRYKKIWFETGPPLKVLTFRLAEAVSRLLPDENFVVQVGMRYGSPSLEGAINKLEKAGCHKILFLPLYPQYSSTTTGSTFDAVARVHKKQRHRTPVRFIDHYYDHEKYILALANTVSRFWSIHQKPDKLLFSFHGLPQRYVGEGDPYPIQCEKTAALVAKKLDLLPEEWGLCYQSRFGNEDWLEPDILTILKTLLERKASRVHVICPGFAVDGLETLEEVALRYRDLFLKAGGKIFEYIPALNDSEEHSRFLSELVLSHVSGW